MSFVKVIDKDDVPGDVWTHVIAMNEKHQTNKSPIYLNDEPLFFRTYMDHLQRTTTDYRIEKPCDFVLMLDTD